MDTLQNGIILLLKSALTGARYELPQEFDLEAAVQIGRKHQISAMLFYGAVNCGISKELPAMQELLLTTQRVIAASVWQTQEIDRLLSQFEESDIDHLPLKGTLLKRLYPEPEMRVMSDADILIRTEQYDRIVPIMQELGYEAVVESDHELVWHKKAAHIELHKRLIPSYNKDYYAYFGDGWRLGIPAAGYSARYTMKPEDELIYLFTHYAKHYRDAGIGIKHIVDLWVYKSKAKVLDEEYIHTELEKLKLVEFYKNTMRTLESWFGHGLPDEITTVITQTVFDSGVYGTHKAHLLSAMVKTANTRGGARKARTKKIVEVIFLPYDKMCQKYTVVQKLPVLLPVMWVVRWFDVLLFQHGRINARREEMKITSADNINNYQGLLNFVGLDFNFKE